MQRGDSSIDAQAKRLIRFLPAPITATTPPGLVLPLKVVCGQPQGARRLR